MAELNRAVALANPKRLFNHFQVLGVKRRETKRFRMLVVQTRLRLFDLDEELFAKLTEYILKDTFPDDMIAVKFTCDGYHKEGFVPFKPVDKFNAQDIVTMIEKISQSNTDCNITNEMYLEYTIRYPPLPIEA